MEKPYILYIDDERPAIDLVCKVLRPLGYEVEGTTSGEEGLAAMQQRKPDLLLLDLIMPQVSGLDVYRELRQDVSLEAVPVVVLTAKVPDNDRLIMADLPPVDDYITKPFKLNRLRRTVDEIVHTKRSDTLIRRS